jgi:hypothetical protein
VNGEIIKPDANYDPVGAANWTFNDTYAKVLIANTVTAFQMVHIGRAKI